MSEPEITDAVIEVTADMIRAAQREDGRLCEFQDADVAAIFRAMLAAGPKRLTRKAIEPCLTAPCANR